MRYNLSMRYLESRLGLAGKIKSVAVEIEDGYKWNLVIETDGEIKKDYQESIKNSDQNTTRFYRGGKNGRLQN